MANVYQELMNMNVTVRPDTAAKTVTKIWDHRVKRVHAETVELVKKIASETTNVSAQLTSPGNSARRLSSRIHCARRTHASITERVAFHLSARPMNANVWKASPAIDAKLTSTIVNHSHVKIMEFVSMRLADFHVTVVEPATLAIYVKKTLTNVPEIHVKTTASALTIMAVTRASVDRALVETIAIKLSTNANRRRASMVGHASRRIKVTLSAFVAKVFRDSFVKLHPFVPIVPMIRNVLMVGVFASKA
jgi:hypothetical protein